MAREVVGERFVSIFDEEMKAQIEGHWEMLTNEE